MSSNKSLSSLTSILLKLAALVYVFSMFFASNDGAENGIATLTEFPILLKIIIIAIYGLFLVVLERMYFLILFFSSFIILPLLKILSFLSDPILEWNPFLNLSDEFLIIAMSVYFMFRYFRERKRKDYNHSNKRKHVFKQFFAHQEKTHKHRTKKMEELIENQESIN